MASDKGKISHVSVDDQVWFDGLHHLHCREDRCCFGCSCPCHHGVRIPPLPGRIRLLVSRLWNRA